LLSEVYFVYLNS